MRKHGFLCRLTAAAIAAAACTSFSSCEKKAERAAYAPPEFKLVGSEKQGAKNIYLIVKNTESSYWQVMIDAAGEAADDFGCNVYYSGTTNEGDWEIQSELVDIAVERGADAILFAPDDSVKLSPVVSDLHKSGMPVVLVDTVVNTDEYDICYMTDNLMAGQNAAAEMLVQMKAAGVSESEPAKVAIQVGVSTSQTITERLAGFCQYWSHNAPEKWEIIDEIMCNEGSVDLAYDCAESFFKKYDDIDGVFGTNNGSTVGFAKYILDNELTDVAIVGFDYSEEMSELITSGSYHSATMLQKQYDMSYLGVQSAVQLIDGSFVRDCKYVDTGVVVVNHDNLTDPEVADAVEHN